MTGDDIKALRERTHLPQEALARIVGVSNATVHRWERVGPKRIEPSMGVLLFLQALDGASRHDTDIVRHIADWRDRGPIYFWARIFKLSYEHLTKEAR